MQYFTIPQLYISITFVLMKQSIYILFFSLYCITGYTQNVKQIKINKNYSDFTIQRKQTMQFSFKLKKDEYYAINVFQKGIDVELYLKNSNQKVLKHQDSPNGKNGIEKIIFSPEKTSQLILLIKPFDEPGNSQAGDFSIHIKNIPKKLKKINKKDLIEDLNVLQNIYLETKVGLWYKSLTQLDSIFNLQKSKIKKNMTSVDFYKILAPITAFTNEGHCNIKYSEEANIQKKRFGKYLPFVFKIFEDKVYLLNDVEQFQTKGLRVLKINNHSIDTILNQFLNIEPSDGYNITSKYKWIESAFSKYYLTYFEFNPKNFELELLNTDTKQHIKYKDIPSYDYKKFGVLLNKLKSELPNLHFKNATEFKIDSISKTAMLTVNSFSIDDYKNGRNGFKKILKDVFLKIQNQHIDNLVIDIRKNEGGAQGMEDYLLSYLINKPYKKYKYVEIPSFTFSFLQFTDYKNEADILKNELLKDFYRENDGRIINKKDHYLGAKPKKNNFKGNVYILIGGLTFSGGSEFAALAKIHTNAIFIGEETGGGFYGNTSGDFISFELPNSHIKGRVPMCKFVLETNKTKVPFGSGLLPDYTIKETFQDFIKRIDAPLEHAIKLIKM